MENLTKMDKIFGKIEGVHRKLNAMGFYPVSLTNIEDDIDYFNRKEVRICTIKMQDSQVSSIFEITLKVDTNLLKLSTTYSNLEITKEVFDLLNTLYTIVKEYNRL